MNQAIFLDRDGTINEDVGYFCTPDKLKFIPRAIAALQNIQKHFQLFIITNQSGIAKGFFTEKEFLQFNEYFIALLANQKIYIKKVYYCPHNSEDSCLCHKPKPYFLFQAKEEFDIDFSRSYVIGDHPSDMEMAHRAGIKPIYLLTGHGVKHSEELFGKDVDVARDLFDAAVLILSRLSGV